jgi:hypothetical protein
VSPIHGILELLASVKVMRTNPLPNIKGPICPICEQPVSYFGKKLGNEDSLSVLQAPGDD